MNKELTFNDLPMVVAQLRDEVVGMKQMIIGLQSQNKPHKANKHIPMSVEEASAYLKMPMATLYMKLGNGSIPATKPGKRYCLYQDELDKCCFYLIFLSLCYSVMIDVIYAFKMKD